MLNDSSGPLLYEESVVVVDKLKECWNGKRMVGPGRDSAPVAVAERSAVPWIAPVNSG